MDFLFVIAIDILLFETKNTILCNKMASLICKIE